ncbi:ADA regulatory protein / Methylated-DNA--protein-cysteine methyltransferase [Myxococcus hansupus]|uniref:DNA-3-methyladenine glycosylase II n=1 Tax=Pseudomyxococcus hansupus TaxID=1297742 RepID=A0A0H4WXI4_9BACT|nr:AlkA N-terminal domain-containing protein [Myxococcus hansupus]AKQ67514.1 ADA regulatory protein / Methylated-DNA--protein-cysteine methyltransferase [Myxococcus hansupus]
MTALEPSACYRAVQTRDARFDGRFFTAVRTTRIYCRPICPARTPRFENCTFFPSAAGAQEAGYRPCLRCRPETSPDLAFWRGTSNTVARALALIAEGGMDDEGAGVTELADRLGVGDRQLRRLFQQHLGASPVAVAQTRRVLFARQLLHETSLPMAEVALAAGFRSVRRFNAVFRSLHGRPPRELRRSKAPETHTSTGVTLFIPYRPPYDWESMLAHLEARALPGLEYIEAGRYRRTVAHARGAGSIEVSPAPRRAGFLVTLRLPEVQALPGVVAQVRRVFDVGADVDVIGAHLSRDPRLAPLVARRPGLRAPGGWDGFELAVRAVLGQQVTVVAARGLGARLVAEYGEPALTEATGHPRLLRTFPRPERLVGEDLRRLGMPAARAKTLSSLAAAAVADPRLFQPGASLEEAITRFKRIPGIGDWTAQYIALRAVRETDAFPSADVALLRALEDDAGVRPTPDAVLRRSEAWSPWRAYAAQHLWAADAERSRAPSPTKDNHASAAATAH